MYESFNNGHPKPPQEIISPEIPQTADSILNNAVMDSAIKQKLAEALDRIQAEHERKIAVLIEKNKELASELEVQKELATIDPLTQVANRKGREKALELMHSAQAREQIPIDYSLIYIDLNNFKTINDTLGHQAGDDTLVAIVNQLKKTIRPSTDTLARLGGDEFSVILPKTSEEQAVMIAQRILDGILGPVNAALRESYPAFPGVAASFGVASFADVERDNPALDDDAFISTADSLMYEAKEHKKIDPLAGKIVRYSETKKTPGAP